MEITETEINGLTADIYEPTKKQRGTIIMANGYCGSRQAPHRIKRAMTFAENGFKVITYDYRSLTSKKPTKTLTEDLNDLFSIIGYCKGNVGLVGDSWGGTLALHAASRNGRVKAVVARVPTIDLENFEKNYIAKELDSFEKKVTSPKMIEDVAKYTSYDIAERIKAPVMIIVGKNDTTCPPEYARKFFGLLNGEKRFVEFDAGHDFFGGELLEKLTSESLRWFQRWL